MGQCKGVISRTEHHAGYDLQLERETGNSWRKIGRFSYLIGVIYGVKARDGVAVSGNTDNNRSAA